MRRQGRESGDQRREDGAADRMQRKIRRTPQAGRRLQLFRFHAEPQLRHRRPEPDAGRTKKDRRAIYRLSRPRAAKPYRRRLHGKARIAAAGVPDQRKGAAAGGSAQQAAGRERDQAAPEGRQLRAAFLLLRLAAAFGKLEGSEEAVQRPFAEQGEAGLGLSSSRRRLGPITTNVSFFAM